MKNVGLGTHSISDLLNHFAMCQKNKTTRLEFQAFFARPPAAYSPLAITAVPDQDRAASRLPGKVALTFPPRPSGLKNTGRRPLAIPDRSVAWHNLDRSAAPAFSAQFGGLPRVRIYGQGHQFVQLQTIPILRSASRLEQLFVSLCFRKMRKASIPRPALTEKIRRRLSP